MSKTTEEQKWFSKRLATLVHTPEGYVAEVYPDDLERGKRHVAKKLSGALAWVVEKLKLHGWAQEPQNRLDRTIFAIARVDLAGGDASDLHVSRHRLTAEGLQCTMTPFCYQCESEDIVGWGALCKSCLGKKGKRG